jgi:hypothetical protein
MTRIKRTIIAIAFVALFATLSFSGVSADKPPPPAGTAPSPELANSHFVTNAGERAATGGCHFKGYRLHLEPGGKAVAARQVSIDYDTCTELIEVGTPTRDDEATPAGQYSDATEQAKEPATPAAVGVDMLTASSYHNVSYHVWWEDPVSADVTKTYANLQFDNIDGCVYNSSGSAYYWWRSSTGWKKLSSSAHLYRPTQGWCVPTSDQPTRSRSAYTQVDSKFQAVSVFCYFLEVNNFYENVTVKGYYDGSVDGWVDDTWVVEPPVCPPLHWHSTLVR